MIGGVEVRKIKYRKFKNEFIIKWNDRIERRRTDVGGLVTWL